MPDQVTVSALTVYLTIGLIVILMYQLYKKPSALKITEFKVRQQMLQMNYEKDMEYLFSFIHYMIERSMTLVIKPKIASNIGGTGRGLITDEILSEECKRILSVVIPMISPSYRAVLSKYYTTDKIDEYIADYLYTELSLTAMRHNLSVANKGGFTNATSKE